MNNVTTHETAQRLKAAGFPQPVPEFGQVWYDDEEQGFFVITGIYEDQMLCGRFFGENGKSFIGLNKNYLKVFSLFAPTATDILRELDFEFNLWFSPQKGEYLISKDIGHFCGPENVAMHVNPAEAAALAYLSLHEKTEQQ